MPGRVKDLTLDILAAVPEPCRSCVFWQSASGARGGAARDLGAKEAWWQATQLEWGTPGKAALDHEQVIAYTTFAPPNLVPRSRVLGPPASDDALLLAMVWVAAGHRRGGIGRQLVQTVCREAIARGAKALEAYGHPPADGHACSCGLPPRFLEATGFQLRRTDREAPLYRLDLKSTVRWKETVGHAVGDLIAVLGKRERARQPVRPSATVSEPPTHSAVPPQPAGLP